ncbi:hypothetical protein MN608_08372 [Microdochium nivale]|nr:hypothetical protein MN608_08372 [Microdochium nivale]
MAAPTREPVLPLQCVVDNLQLQSSLFGRLPAELRQLIYNECWLASGPQQHIFRNTGPGRVKRHGSASLDDHSPAPQLTHFPCCKTDDDDDEIAAEHDHILETRRRSRSRVSAYFVDEVWSSRFDSPWLDHWRCEEAMREEAILQDFAGDGDARPARRRTLFLPMLLCCRRMYQEALASIYTATTFIYTDLPTAHRSLVSLPAPTVSLVQSLSFPMALHYDTMHQHQYYSSPGRRTGPWAELCVAMSDMVRFDSLKSVVMRLDLADASSTRSIDDPPRSPTSGNIITGRGYDSAATSHSSAAAFSSSVAGGPNDDEHRMWWQVRERWVLSPIRGMLARRLTMQLPERRRQEGAGANVRRRVSLPATRTTKGNEAHGGAVEDAEHDEDHDESPDWMHLYQYRAGDATPFTLQRYRRCRLPKNGMVVVAGGRSGTSSGPSSPKSIFFGPKSPRGGVMDGSRPNCPSRHDCETKVATASEEGEVASSGKVQRRLKALIKSRARD